MSDVKPIAGSEIGDVEEDINDSNLLLALFLAKSEPKNQRKSK